MNKLQDRQCTMFARVKVFAAKSEQLFPAGSLGRRLLDDVVAGLAEINKLSPTQMGEIGNARRRTKDKTDSRKALTADLRRIIRTAKFIADTIPGFDAPYKLPKSQGDAALLYTARQIVKTAATSADVFCQFSMPATFLDDLYTHIRIIEQSTESRAAVRVRHMEATAAIDALISKCMKAVADFDVVATNTLREDPATLAVWKSTRHVQRSAPQKKIPIEA